MQLSTRAQDYVIDMLALRGRVSAHLGKLFMNENFVKVLHGADHDVIWLQRDAGLYLVNYFDTAIAAKELAYKSHSLAHLLEKHCAVQKDKKMQLADWRVRPLSEEMMRYALSDTFYLLDIYAQLRIELHAKGSASAVQAVLEASKEVALRRYEHERFNASGYLGVLSKIRPPAGSAPKSPSDRLDWDLQEKCLAALWDWRDAVARYEDESVGYTLSVTNMLLLSRLYFEKNRAKAASKGNMMEDVELSDLRGALSPLPTLVETYKEHMVRLLNAAATSNDAEIAAVLSEYDVDEGDIVEDLRSTFKTPRRRPTDPELDDEMQEVQILSGARPPRSSQAFSQASTPLPLLNAANTAELTRFRTSTSPFVFTPPPIGPSFETSLSFDGTTSPTMRVAQPSPVLGTAALYSQAGWSIQVEEDAKPGSEASLKPASGFALGDEARLEGVDEAKADSVRKGLNREPLFSLSVADFLEESAETDTKNILEAVLGSIVTGEEEMDTDVAKADDGAEADGTTDGAADEGATIPQSLEEIYHVSNRNRKRNKDKKKLKYMTQEEAQAFLAKRGPAEGGVKGVQQSQIVREMSSEKRIVASKEDTINFMEAIGWINSEQRDSLRETYVANAHQGGPGSSAGGMPGSGPGMGMGAAGGAPVAGQGSGMAAGGGPGVGYHGNQQRQRHPAGNARPQMNATANAAYRGNTGNRYDRTLAAIGAFGGTGAAMGQGDAPGGPREKPKVNANPFLPAQGFNRGGQRNSGAKQGHHRGGGGRRNQRDGRSMTYRSYQH
uniref:3'-5' exonuclease domain-containing protein n=1 Tax=Pinguiococcus pyrenoidosus TaxID=172671 RepID=A0A7R9U4W7_9STRA